MYYNTDLKDAFIALDPTIFVGNTNLFISDKNVNTFFYHDKFRNARNQWMV